jgi:non-ribosomal peptide synthetase component F
MMMRDRILSPEQVLKLRMSRFNPGKSLERPGKAHDGKFVDSSGAFLVGELERIDRTEHPPLYSVTWDTQLLHGWNDTAVSVPESTLPELFEAQAERTPEAVAVVYEEQSLSYGELNRRANQLAHLLRERGVGPETIVGICIERSLEMVVGLLGILKAGARICRWTRRIRWNG